MKKKILAGVMMAACFVLLSGVASAHDYDRDDDGHPLRIVAYLMHPVGLALEYAIVRPIHHVASQPTWNVLLGHTSYENDKLWGWE
ncbi:MAG: hypothetical protein Kow0059_19820 [Candidatus Sumerlaeia bacterium]